MRTIPGIASTLVLLLAGSAPAATATAAPAQTDKGAGFSLPFNSCAGEQVFISGAVTHSVTKVNEDGSTFSLVQMHGTATAASGTEYVYNSIHRTTTEPGDFAFEARQNLVSKGSVPNHTLLIRITTNPTEVTVTPICHPAP